MEYIFRHPYKDRTFSQIMRHFLSFFISKIDNLTHIHIPFPTKELNDEFETIFDTKMVIDGTENNYDLVKLRRERKIYSAPDQNLVKMSDSKNKININKIFSDENLALMKRAYRLTKTSHLDSNINVCVHIRRGDVVNENSGRFTHINFFADIIEKIQNLKIPNCIFHIYSDSEIELKNKGNIQYHINSDLMLSIHEMIKSDIFIMSIGSNLSQFAAIMNESLVFLDKKKLKPCFNNNYNIYWSEHKNIIIEEEEFMKKIQEGFND